jgi:methylase of polypeptide subunit release factors
MATFKEKALEIMINTQEFENELNKIAIEIKNVAKKALNEATMATNFELKLYAFLKNELGIDFEPTKEEGIETRRHIKKGRIDSRIGLLVVEYKHHSQLRSSAQQKKATEQLKNYVEHMDGDVKNKSIGIITDGVLIKFISKVGSELESETIFQQLCGKHLVSIVKAIISSEQKSLTPKNLVNSFCSEEGIAKKLSKVLFDTIKSNPTGRTRMLFTEWQSLFRLAHDDESKQKAIEERRTALSAALDISLIDGDNITEYQALYSIQTAYAIIVKAIAYKTLIEIRGDACEYGFKELATSSSITLRTHLENLESGAIFRSEGFGNLLEGDFFAWYCTSEQWNSDIAEYVRQIFEALSEYENQSVFNDEQIQDLFKELYQGVIPEKVRHSLGEFYTPSWLADHTINEALTHCNNKNDWRAIDPCCGSGTFLTVLIKKVIKELEGIENNTKLKAVLNRVKGVDLNPLATLTARINYFINISHLIECDSEFDIPVFLGNSANLPSNTKIDGIECVSYKIGTEKGDLLVNLPSSTISDVEVFSKVMTKLELHIENEDEHSVYEELCSITSDIELTHKISKELKHLALNLVSLQKEKWNGIWARIVCNFLTTANLGKFDVVVGNPPWIDWKNLPQGYREEIKDLCISRHLFSGDGRTGGINLNICALITNVTAQNWLSDDGALAFLMPQTLIFQQSYEGFRKLEVSDNQRLYFKKFIDWTQSGHPFSPVQQKFLTFIITKEQVAYDIDGVLVEKFIKKANEKTNNIKPLREYLHETTFTKLEHIFKKEELVALTTRSDSTVFTYANSKKDLLKLQLISGVSAYKGREGVEIYPQELFLLEVDEKKPVKNGKVYVSNIQNSKSKHKIAKQNLLLETDCLHPLIKGVDIERFGIKPSKLVVPFPYREFERAPIEKKELSKTFPELMKYFNKNKSSFENQTKYNDKIIGKKNATEFYSLARVGAYSFAEHFVAFRDNTKWQASVVSSVETPWGETKRPIFQNHAVTISQRPDGSFISLDEAHFICALLNSSMAREFIMNSSDSRSFKVNPPLNIPVYDAKNVNHIQLSNLSHRAHALFKRTDKNISKNIIDSAIDNVVLKIIKKKKTLKKSKFNSTGKKIVK